MIGWEKEVPVRQQAARNIFKRALKLFPKFACNIRLGNMRVFNIGNNLVFSQIQKGFSFF
jgi:hypothetical protein